MFPHAPAGAQCLWENVPHCRSSDVSSRSRRGSVSLDFFFHCHISDVPSRSSLPSLFFTAAAVMFIHAASGVQFSLAKIIHNRSSDIPSGCRKSSVSLGNIRHCCSCDVTSAPAGAQFLWKLFPLPKQWCSHTSQLLQQWCSLTFPQELSFSRKLSSCCSIDVPSRSRRSSVFSGKNLTLPHQWYFLRLPQELSFLAKNVSTAAAEMLLVEKLNKTEYKSSYFAENSALHTSCGFQYHAEIDPCQVAHKRPVLALTHNIKSVLISKHF